jgi:transposase-like protein
MMIHILEVSPSEQRWPLLARDGLRSYPAAIREPQTDRHIAWRCRQRTQRYCKNRIESDHRHIKR